ncbi:MAG: DUF4007 family protein [Balneolales bacterium]
MSKLSFSGHDSFICKQFWLKKGYDFVLSEKKFTAETAVVDLGVGKNMVSSIRYWLKSFGLTDNNDNLVGLADYIFGAKGKDPFIEDIGTLWLLHYQLIVTGKASLYSIIFNQFRKEKPDFTKAKLHSFAKRKCLESDSNYTENTVDSDIAVFLKNYVKPKEGKINIEDDYLGLLQDLNLIKQYRLANIDDKQTEWYKIENEIRDDLPYQLVLYAIIDNNSYSNTISFNELKEGFNSPGSVFALSKNCLFNKIEEIIKNYPQITFSETAGNQVLQIKSKPTQFDVLNGYYK